MKYLPTYKQKYWWLTKGYILFFLILLLLGCKRNLELPAPITTVNSENVYKDELSSSAVLTGIYATLSNSFSNSIIGLSVFAGLSADELILSDLTLTTYTPYFQNRLSVNTTPQTGTIFWTNSFMLLYRCNAAIEGLTKSTTLNPVVKARLIGEAKFMRAYFNFYLVNLYGDIPLLLNTDYKSNASASRKPVAEVYKEIINDLKDAKGLLPDNFVGSDILTSTTERIRPTKCAAQALLARVYLYTQDYDNCESEASQVINNKTLVDTVALANVFLKNSKETIWALQPVITGRNTDDALIFMLPSTGPTPNKPFHLNEDLLAMFESPDKRRTSWTGQVISNGKTYVYPFKYKVGIANQPVTEYTILFRIAEQYLIRAEARVKQGKLADGAADLNTIRKRAGLGVTSASTQSDLIDAIAKERQTEFFTEMGQRWFDLKRTNTANSIMQVATSKKGGQWKSEWQLYPIPNPDILANRNLLQNPGY